MDILKQPHDKFFRSIFGRVTSASDLLANYLPTDLVETIDISTLEPQKGSFLDEKLKEEFSDLLFKIMINNKEGYIYFLFEHKSYKDKMVIFQVLKYMLNIWESKIQEDKNIRKTAQTSTSGQIELPIILPLVIYHANSEWNIARTLGDMISNYHSLPEGLKKYIPDFEYLLIDLSNFSKNIMKLRSENIICIRALTRARYASEEEARDILEDAVALINKTKEKDDITYYVSACIRYMMSVRDDISKKEMVEIAGRISAEGGELVMSIAEKLRQEGLHEGRKETSKNIAKNMIADGESVEKIVRYTRLTLEEVAEVKEELLKKIHNI